jgi:hypothetical protein
VSPPSRVYLDTNIYSYIAATNEAVVVREVLDSTGWIAVASIGHLEETWRIRDESIRIAEVAAITTVAGLYDHPPESFRQAGEVLAEIRRCRPAWLARMPGTSKIPVFLNFHLRMWKEARQNPAYLPPGLEAHDRDFESGVAQSRDFHKSVRSAVVDANKHREEPILRYVAPDPPSLNELHDSLEVFWRSALMLIWKAALVDRKPASRDYFDWVAPYLGRRQLDGFADFWIKDVEADLVPRNRLPLIVEYYQGHRKWGHGNPADSQHACQLLDCDAFVTADRAFYDILLAAAAHYPRAAELVLLDRSAPNVVEQLAPALASPRSSLRPARHDL